MTMLKLVKIAGKWAIVRVNADGTKLVLEGGFFSKAAALNSLQQWLREGK
jgi:hypothetical protein